MKLRTVNNLIPAPKDGDPGKDGVGCMVYEWYELTNSSTAPTTLPSRSSDGSATANGWILGTNATAADLTPTSEKPYLWNVEETVTIDSDGVYSSVFSPAHLDAWYTADGRGIKSITDTYCASADNVNYPTSGYDLYDNAIAFWTIDKPYLWDKTVVTFDDGKTSERYHVCAIYGQAGLSGMIEDEVIRHYLATSAASGVTVNTEGWTTEPQSVTAEKKYLWYYETRKYKALSENGKNLLLGTRTMSDPAVIKGDIFNTSGSLTDENGNVFTVLYSYVYSDFNYIKKNTYADSELTLTLQGTVTTLPSIMREALTGSVVSPSAGDTYRKGTSLFVFNGSNWEENKQTYATVLEYEDALTPVAGETYTLSFFARGNCTLYAYFYPECAVEMTDSKGNSKTFASASDGICTIDIASSSYERYWIRWKAGDSVSGTKNVIVCRLVRDDAAQYVRLYGVKLRKGSDVDDWSPNPEDLTTTTTPVIIGVYGDKGDKGAVLRGPMNWEEVEEGFQFLSGAEGESYLDYVVYKDVYYVCGKSHTKTSTNDPKTSAANNDGYWSVGSEFAIVIATILVAAYARINELGVKSINITDDDGNIVLKADKSGITCNTGEFTDGTFVNMTAKSGKIAGFKISGNTLTNEGLNNDAAVMFRNTLTNCLAAIGASVGAAGTALSTVGNFANDDTTNRCGTGRNVAILLSATNGKYNNAFMGKGNGTLNGFIAGYKLSIHTCSAASVIDSDSLIIENNKWLIKNSYSGAGIQLPLFSDVCNALGINSGSDFCIEFTVIANTENSEAFYLYGRNTIKTTSGTQLWNKETLPLILDENANTADYIQMYKGDSITLMLIYDSSASTTSRKYTAKILNRND